MRLVLIEYFTSAHKRTVKAALSINDCAVGLRVLRTAKRIPFPVGNGELVRNWAPDYRYTPTYYCMWLQPTNIMQALGRAGAAGEEGRLARGSAVVRTMSDR